MYLYYKSKLIKPLSTRVIKLSWKLTFNYTCYKWNNDTDQGMVRIVVINCHSQTWESESDNF